MMQENNQRITELELKAAAGDLSPEEERELLAFLNQDPENWKRFEERTDPQNVRERLARLQRFEDAKKRSLSEVLVKLHGRPDHRMVRWTWLAAAASVVLLASGA